MKIGELKIGKKHRPVLDEALNRRLISYATAATAAGVGLLGLAPSAGAQIVYTPAHVVIGFNASYPLDLSHDGTTDFVIADEPSANSSTVFNPMLARPRTGNGIEGSHSSAGRVFAAALVPGARIGSSQRFLLQPLGVIMASTLYSPGGREREGHWINVTDRYLGLKFEINGEAHFGWARFNVQVRNVHSVTATLTGYAYETAPNTPIMAGQTDNDAEAPAAGPESLSFAPTDGSSRVGTLGLLALGSSGLPDWRRSQAPADGGR